MRPIRHGLFGLAGLLLVLLVSLVALVGTQAGSRWLLVQVPGLQVDGFQGRLGGSWQAAQLSWQQGDTRVQVLTPRLRASPSCLLRMTLCIEQLHSGPVQVFYPEAQSPSSEPLVLPALRLPVALHLDDVQIERLQLNGVEQLETLQLAARWDAQGVQIDRLSLKRDDLHLALSGQLQTQGDWPVNLNAHVQLPAPDKQAWPLTLQLTGALGERLLLNGTSQGYLNAELSGWLQPLDAHLPAELSGWPLPGPFCR
jgi:translocation and assembly module TamB